MEKELAELKAEIEAIKNNNLEKDKLITELQEQNKLSTEKITKLETVEKDFISKMTTFTKDEQANKVEKSVDERRAELKQKIKGVNN